MKAANDEINNKPWYKQFWPWFIIAIPASSVIAGIAMIIVATDGADPLVKENYYKDGLAINRQFEKIQHAYDLDIKAEITIENDFLILNTSSKNLQDNLFLDFRHATQERKDFNLSLQQRANGQYFAPLTRQNLQSLNGKWHITLRPHSGDWELENSWFNPKSSSLLLGESHFEK